MNLENVEELRRLVERHGSIRAVERALRERGHSISERTIRRRLQDDVASDIESTSEVPPILDIEELIEERRRKFARLKSATEAARTRTVHLRTNQPIGIGFFGDMHLDDDGTDIARVLRDVELFDGRQKGLYAAFLGDIWNNWVGRLTRLWADQSTNTREAQALVEHVFGLVRWLFVIAGNHDLWNGKTDLLEYMLREQTRIYAAHEQRVRLVFPNGRELTILARHKFSGHSQYLKQFGQVKSALFAGNADIYIGADKHVAGYTNGWHDGQKRMFHAVQVASYKELDDYPVELGLTPADLFQCPVAIIDPKAATPLNFVRWEFDPREGAERLEWHRSRV